MGCTSYVELNPVEDILRFWDVQLRSLHSLLLLLPRDCSALVGGDRGCLRTGPRVQRLESVAERWQEELGGRTCKQGGGEGIDRKE